MKTADIVRGAGLILMVGLGLVPACTDALPTATRSCPCAAGNVCCSSGVCATSEGACAAAAFGLAREAQGVWTGYLENFTFPSGSDALEIALSAAGEQMSAAVTLGAVGLPEPSFEWPPADGGPIIPDTLATHVREGFRYQAVDLRWESRRLKLRVRLRDSWTEYCAAYPLVTVDDYSFYCPRSGGYGPDTGCIVEVRDSHVPVDCSLIARCFDPRCKCDESSCVAMDVEAGVDLTLGDGFADGSVVFEGLPINVHLVRQPETRK